MQLHRHQKVAVRNILTGLKDGHKQQLVVIPTGGGKTVIACYTVKRVGGRALFIVHTDELVRQTVRTLQQFFSASSIGIIKGKIDEGSKQFVVASVQSLRQKNRLKRLARDFQTVVWDECHHAQAGVYLRIRQHFAKAKPLHLGLTATPWRLDGKSVDDLFPHNSVKYTIKDGVGGGWLSGVVGKLIYLKDANFSKLKLKHGDFKPSELEQVMRAANWDEHVEKAYFEHAGKRKTIIFVPTVAMAHQLAERIRAKGGLAEAIDGKMNAEKRRDIIARLVSGKLNVVINCAVLTEGFDDPLISCVIMARPTASWRLYVQCVGRGLRPVEGKTCLVLDMVGATRRHSLVSFPLFAKQEGIPNGGKPSRQRGADDIGLLSANQEALWVDLLEDCSRNPHCIFCKGITRKSTRWANGNRSYKCTKCYKSFVLTPSGQPTRSSFNRGTLKPPCVFCEGKTRKAASLTSGNTIYQCIECRKHFTLAPDGQPTKQAVALRSLKPPCIFCKGKTKLGRLSPDGNRAYKCTGCQKMFTLTSDGRPSKQSISINTPNPPCAYCSGKTTKAILRANGNRAYSCIECKKGFTLTPSGQLSEQSVKQRELKPSCIFCKGETKAGALYLNEKKGYKCKECKKGFTLTLDGKVAGWFAARSKPNPPCAFCNGKTKKGPSRPSGSQSYKCTECQKCFTITSSGQLSKQSLARHSEINKGGE